MSDVAWPASKVAELREAWAKGFSLGQIARLLGKTRGGIAGKAARLRLHLQPFAILRRRLSPEAAASPRLLPPPTTTSEKVYALKRHECRWPFGDTHTPEFSFCCAPKAPGSPYCAEHHSVGFAGVPQRRRKYVVEEV